MIYFIFLASLALVTCYLAREFNKQVQIYLISS